MSRKGAPLGFSPRHKAMPDAAKAAGVTEEQWKEALRNGQEWCSGCSKFVDVARMDAPTTCYGCRRRMRNERNAKRRAAEHG